MEHVKLFLISFNIFLIVTSVYFIFKYINTQMFVFVMIIMIILLSYQLGSFLAKDKYLDYCNKKVEQIYLAAEARGKVLNDIHKFVRNELVYEYKGNDYLILDTVDMKNPETREWQKAVVYINLKNPEITYVREQDEFLKRFKPIHKK